MPSQKRDGPLGMGCNSLGHLPAEAAARLVGTALDRGVTFFDTANLYAEGRSESELGRLLPREGVTVATKFGHPASVPPGVAPCAPEMVGPAVDASLARLRRDRINLCLIHFPDPATPIAATLEALAVPVAAGKIERWGLSNFSPAGIAAAIAAADEIGLPRPSTIQDEYNLIRRGAETALLPAARRLGLDFIPFFPLAGGLLTGKYRRDGTGGTTIRSRAVRGFGERFLHEENFRKLDALERLCSTHGVTMLSIALQWLRARPGVSTIIAGASDAEQLAANADALARPLPNEILAAADRLFAPNPNGEEECGRS
jgi:aryl-alcohol dehydrogenase-like predicted oxidoreductase